MPQPAFSGSQISISDGVIHQDGVYYIQYPKIASLKDGGFIAVWQQYTHTDTPYDGEATVRARVFNADGTARGAEFQVNGPVGYFGDERDVGAPDVAVLKDGRVLIAWTQGIAYNADYDDKADTRYSFYDPETGILTATSNLFPKDYTSSSGHDTDGLIGVTATVNGGFIISSGSSNDDNTEKGSSVIYVDSAGARKFLTFGFDKTAGSNITGLTNGGYVYTQISTKQYGPLTSKVLEVRVWIPPTSADRYDDTFKTIVVNEAFTTEAHDPSVVALTNGNFAVVWCDGRAITGDGSGSSIKARIFRNDGTAASGDIIVNTTTVGWQNMPVVAALPDGGFAVAFQDVKGMYDIDVRVATFNAMGGRVSDDLLVTGTDGQQISPTITTLKDGRFVVSWRDTSFSLRAQIFGTATTNPDTNPDPNPTPTEQTLPGGAGNDELNGTAIAGLFDGREGFDTVTYASSQGHVVVFVDPALSGFNQGDAARDRYTSIEAVIGTDYNDELIGNEEANRLIGGKGNDYLEGKGGNDTLIGGEGNDTLIGGEGADTLDGGTGDNDVRVNSEDTDITASVSGTQTVQSSVNYTLSASAPIDILKATAKAGTINLTGNGFQNTIIGNASKNTLKGQGGNDKVFGGAGKDALSGGTGKDTFVFDTKAGKSNLDTITDFSVKYDSIWLDNKIFTKLGKAGSETKPVQLKKGFFVVGDEAQDRNDYLIYNKETSVLSYDADGSGKGLTVEIAIFANKPNLTYRDFFVI